MAQTPGQDQEPLHTIPDALDTALAELQLVFDAEVEDDNARIKAKDVERDAERDRLKKLRAEALKKGIKL